MRQSAHMSSVSDVHIQDSPYTDALCLTVTARVLAFVCHSSLLPPGN